MKKQFLILSVLFLFSCSSANSQNYTNQLRSFLENLQDNSDVYIKGNLYIIHLLDYEKFDNKRKGIYKFGIIGSHEKPFLAFFDGNEMLVEKEYKTFELIDRSISFIRKYESEISELEKATYLENISFVIKKNILPDGWELIEEDIIIDQKP